MNWVSIGSDNGLSPSRHQAFIWTKAGILLIGPLGTNLSEIRIKIQNFSSMKMFLKTSFGKWWPLCLGLSVLNANDVQGICFAKIPHRSCRLCACVPYFLLIINSKCFKVPLLDFIAVVLYLFSLIFAGESTADKSSGKRTAFSSYCARAVYWTFQILWCSLLNFWNAAVQYNSVPVAWHNGNVDYILN